MKLGVITGATRKGNVGTAIGNWVVRELNKRSDIEVVDLKIADFNLDFLSEETLPAMAAGNYENAETQAWSRTIAGLDGFVFVTAEYNAAPPAVFKNAVDLLFTEWNNKPVGFVGYGFHKAERAIAHWRDICANVKMVVAKNQVGIHLGEEPVADGIFSPADTRAAELNELVDELLA